MKFSAKSTNWAKIEADALVLAVSEGNWQKELGSVDAALGKQLVSHLKLEQFRATLGEIHSFPTQGKLPARTLLVVGTGKSTTTDLRQSMAVVGKYARTHRYQRLAVDLVNLPGGLEATILAQIVVEGLILGLYHFSRYKSEVKKDPHEVADVLLLANPARLQQVANGMVVGQLYAQATTYARDLVNESPTITTPTYLSHVAKKLIKRGEISVDVLEEKEMRRLGMGAILAVTRGSAEPAKFIVLKYKSGSKKKVALVGKAITFDTGGLSLKDAKNMETMKSDMAGAAAVLGLFSVLPKLKPKVGVLGIIAACENMPGSRAVKPGDVVLSANGKSIEILNTDAEGRLTLADALAFAVNQKPSYIVDLATLTGACMVALGEEVAGLFTDNRELGEKLQTAAAAEGEKIWELPLEKDYREQIKSEIADLRNIGKTRYGGAITAALFLQEFTGEIPWAHLDIAGPAFAEKDMVLAPKGGTGFGVRTLLQFLTRL